jgi:hypothetical protein
VLLNIMAFPIRRLGTGICPSFVPKPARPIAGNDNRRRPDIFVPLESST